MKKCSKGGMPKVATLKKIQVKEKKLESKEDKALKGMKKGGKKK